LRLCLEQLSNSLSHVDLHVLLDNPLSTDMGRDFLDKHNLTTTYVPGKFVDENTEHVEIGLFLPELLKIASCYESVTFEDIFDEISIDFDSSIKSKLKHLLLELDQSSIMPIKYNYCVRFNFKDTFEQLSRKRSIIAISAYRRLSITSRKAVFTLLGMKDGFHQIKVHPENTNCKYFFFVTPDGQFEYNKLPFGFCDAPAEFQKRLVQILQPLIRTVIDCLY